MSTKVEIILPPATQGFIQQMEGLTEAMIQAIARGMARGGQIMLGEITRQNFTGQGPFPPSEHRLGVVSNRLRQSLFSVAASPLPTQIAGNLVTATIGTNVEYFAVHEYGFNGYVTYKAHTRRLTLHRDNEAGRGQRGGLAHHERTEIFAIELAGRLHRQGARGKEISKALKKSQIAVGEYQVKENTRRMFMQARAPLRTGITNHQNLMTDEITRELFETWMGRAS